MKTLLFFFILNMSLFELSNAQTTELSDSAYGAIQFNGVTIKSIEKTMGDEQKMKLLFGNPTQVQRHSETMPPEQVVAYFYNKNVIRFSNQELFFIRIDDTSFPLTVLGKQLYLGQTIAQVKQLLQAVNVNSYEGGEYFWISFGSPTNDYDVSRLAFNKSSQKMEFIIYGILP